MQLVYSTCILMSQLTAGETTGDLRKGYFVIMVQPVLSKSKSSLVGYHLYASIDLAMYPIKPLLAAMVIYFDKGPSPQRCWSAQGGDTVPVVEESSGVFCSGLLLFVLGRWVSRSSSFLRHWATTSATWRVNAVPFSVAAHQGHGIPK